MKNLATRSGTKKRSEYALCPQCKRGKLHHREGNIALCSLGFSAHETEAASMFYAKQIRALRSRAAQTVNTTAYLNACRLLVRASADGQRRSRFGGNFSAQRFPRGPQVIRTPYTYSEPHIKENLRWNFTFRPTQLLARMSGRSLEL